MEMQTNNIGTADGQKTEEPKQELQEHGQEQELSQQQQDDEEFQLLVDRLFDEHDPGSALEDANVIRMARALLKGRNLDENSAEARHLDRPRGLARPLKMSVSPPGGPVQIESRASVGNL